MWKYVRKFFFKEEATGINLCHERYDNMYCLLCRRMNLRKEIMRSPEAVKNSLFP